MYVYSWKAISCKAHCIAQGRKKNGATVMPDNNICYEDGYSDRFDCKCVIAHYLLLTLMLLSKHIQWIYLSTQAYKTNTKKQPPPMLACTISLALATISSETNNYCYFLLLFFSSGFTDVYKMLCVRLHAAYTNNSFTHTDSQLHKQSSKWKIQWNFRLCFNIFV